MRFIKVNELKLTQGESFSYVHFMCVAANASELFCIAHLTNNEPYFFQNISNILLKETLIQVRYNIFSEDNYCTLTNTFWNKFL